MLDADTVLNVVFAMIIRIQLPVGLNAELPGGSSAEEVVDSVVMRLAYFPSSQIG